MSRFKKIVLGLILVSVFIVGSLVTEKFIDGFVNSSKYHILKYKINNSTENLMLVCNALALENDDELLSYVNVLLDRPDFEEVYKGQKTDLTWERYNDILIMQTFKCITQSQEDVVLGKAIIEYFPKVKISEPFALLSYKLAENPNFANENKDNIINSIIQLYESSSGKEKQTYLEYIVAYNSYFDINDETALEYTNELKSIFNNMENYEKRFCNSDIEFAKVCCGCMFTGIYDEEIVEYFDFLFKP